MLTSRPPLILRVTGAGDDVAFLVLGDDLFPFLLPLGLAVAEDDGAGLVLDGFEQDLDLVAGLRAARSGRRPRRTTRAAR